MNTLNTIHTEYLRTACRTLETVRVSCNTSTFKDFWIYNYEGGHFRVFTSHQKATDFLNNTSQEYWVDFVDEELLDDFLMGIKF